MDGGRGAADTAGDGAEAMAAAMHPAGALLGAFCDVQQDNNREHKKGRKNCGRGGDGGHGSGLGVDNAAGNGDT